MKTSIVCSSERLSTHKVNTGYSGKKVIRDKEIERKSLIVTYL